MIEHGVPCPYGCSFRDAITAMGGVLYHLGQRLKPSLQAGDSSPLQLLSSASHKEISPESIHYSHRNANPSGSTNAEGYSYTRSSFYTVPTDTASHHAAVV